MIKLGSSIKPKLVLLDVYETMLDMGDVERRVNDLMNSRRGYLVWHELFMQYCFVDNCTVQFHDFSSIAGATLRMASQALGREISEADVGRLLDAMKHLPVREGVQDGLSGLHDLGYRVAALTNAPERIVMERMDRTGLISYFEEVLCAEQVQKYKPAVDVYKWAARKLGLEPPEILLISAHGWDIAGAENAGLRTAYMRQGKQILYPLAPKPDFTCKSLPDLVDQLAKP